jgi:hypothetical protein
MQGLNICLFRREKSTQTPMESLPLAPKGDPGGKMADRKIFLTVIFLSSNPLGMPLQRLNPTKAAGG